MSKGHKQESFLLFQRPAGTSIADTRSLPQVSRHKGGGLRTDNEWKQWMAMNKTWTKFDISKKLVSVQCTVIIFFSLQNQMLWRTSIHSF